MLVERRRRGSVQLALEAPRPIASPPCGRRLSRTVDLHLSYLDLASRRFTPLSAHVPWDVEGFEVSDDGRTVAFVTKKAASAGCTCSTPQRAARKPLRSCPSVSSPAWFRKGLADRADCIPRWVSSLD